MSSLWKYDCEYVGGYEELHATEIKGKLILNYSERKIIFRSDGSDLELKIPINQLQDYGEVSEVKGRFIKRKDKMLKLQFKDNNGSLHSPVFNVDDKQISEIYHNILVLQGKEYPDRCFTCGSELIIGYDEGIRFDTCPACKISRIEDAELTKKQYQVFIGKTLSSVDRDGFIRMRLDYPQTQRGTKIIQMRNLFADRSYMKPQYMKPSMKRGDELAFVCDGTDEHGMPTAIYYQNLTMKTVKGALIPDDCWIEKLRSNARPRPVIRVADYYLSKALTEYEAMLFERSYPTKESPSTKGIELEQLVKELFEKMGFENVYIAGGASDKGIDIEGIKREEHNVERIIAQCKAQSLLNKVKPSQVRDFAHVLAREKLKQPTHGYFITSSYFSPECYHEENSGPDMELIDRDHLEKLLTRYGMSLDRIDS